MNKEVYHKGCNGNLIEIVNSSMNALRDLIPEHLISRFEGMVPKPIWFGFWLCGYFDTWIVKFLLLNLKPLPS